MANDRIKELNDGGYNNLLMVLLGLAALYFLITGVSKTNKQLYLEQAGIDKPTQQAQALRDAMNRSGVALMMSVDGTDVDLIMQTATAIESYPAVSDAYRVLYGSELTIDLQNELSRTDLQRFYDIIYKRNGQGTTTTTTTGGTTTTSLVGKPVTANQTVNVRNYQKPNLTDHQAKKGDSIGTYLGEKDLTVTGKTERFVIVKPYSFWDWVPFNDTKVYVHKASVKIG